MIDDGELDWKVIAINERDPLFPLLDDVDDVEKHCPGVLSGIREWFRWYKTPDGKALTVFGFEERVLPRSAAEEVVRVAHEHWRALRAGERDKGRLWIGL